MDRQINVLVLPCGAESALEVWRALKDVLNITLYGASSRSDHGEFAFKNIVSGIPAVQAPDFIERLNAAIQEHGIAAIFPCHDTVAEVLTANRTRINATVVCSSAETARICRHKFALQELFEPEGIAPVRIDGVPHAGDYPVFAKPDLGEGGKGARMLAKPQDHDRFFTEFDRSGYLLTEYLPGEEATVDCFSDRHGALVFIGPRTRERVWAGISVRTRPLPPAAFAPMAGIIHQRLQPRGLWFFQAKRDARGTWKLLEVSTRVSSSMGLYRPLGANLPLLALYDALDMDVQVRVMDRPIVMDRALVPTYRIGIDYDTVYLDLDDTLLINGRVHGPAIRFAYACVDNGKRLVLITKHASDLQNTLERYRISPRLFDDIIHLKEGEHKRDYIASANSIFIDNAYAERRAVSEAHGIPVFDVDALDALIDPRG